MEHIENLIKICRLHTDQIDDDILKSAADLAQAEYFSMQSEPLKSASAGVMPPMTGEELQAYKWAQNQSFQSVSARYARVLAEYIEKVIAV